MSVEVVWTVVTVILASGLSAGWTYWIVRKRQEADVKLSEQLGEAYRRMGEQADKLASPMADIMGVMGDVLHRLQSSMALLADVAQTTHEGAQVERMHGLATQLVDRYVSLATGGAVGPLRQPVSEGEANVDEAVRSGEEEPQDVRDILS